jgi:hypothetical protein
MCQSHLFASERMKKSTSLISASHWIKLQQAVVSAALVHHENASASEMDDSKNLGMY